MARGHIAWACGLALLLAGSPAPAQNGRRVRLASWNLHNFFDEVDDRYGDETPSAEAVERRVAQLADCLRALKADVIGVQEVEKHSLLTRLARAAGYRYAILVEGNDTQRGIDVALLSRVEVKGYYSHRKDVLPYVEGANRGGRFSRDCLEVHLDLPQPTVVLVNHFKSKVGDTRSSDSKRRAQALAVAAIARDLEKRRSGQGVAVLGDLNDSLESWALEPLAHSSLRDPFASLTLDQRYSLRHRGRKTVLDHILLNPSLMTRVIPRSAGVEHGGDFQRQSDHAPLYVDLRY